MELQSVGVSKTLRKSTTHCGTVSSNYRLYAEELKDKILAMNGAIIPYDDEEIPMSLYAKIIKLENSTLRYSEIFPKLMIKAEEKA